MRTYDIGDIVRPKATFTRADPEGTIDPQTGKVAQIPYDPETVTFRVQDGTGAITTHTYDPDAEEQVIERLGVGVYRPVLVATSAGTWLCEAKADGEAAGMEPFSFVVRASALVAVPTPSVFAAIYAWTRRYLGRDAASLSDAALDMDAAILVPELLAVCPDLVYPGGFTEAEMARFNKAAGLLLALEVEPARLFTRLDSGEGVYEEIQQGKLQTRYSKGGGSKQTRESWTPEAVRRKAYALLYGEPGIACFRAALEARVASQQSFVAVCATRVDCDPCASRPRRWGC